MGVANEAKRFGAGGDAVATEHVDVLIVGAGISGVDAAYHLRKHCPDKRFVLLDSQDSFGGTWLTHKYPGIRSDSDLFTFGYGWKPWSGPPIATAAEILKYMDEAIDEHDLRRHIRFGHQVLSASWSSADQRWTIVARRKDGAVARLSCDFLWMCQGYYRHSKGYTPEWPGMDAFKGPIVHPQTWPEDLDYRGKKVVVIGSGATAATIVPAMAPDCEHVTMLQRSPTYFLPRPNRHELAVLLRELKVPEEWTHEIVRRKILHDQSVFTRRSFEDSDSLREELIGNVRRMLPENYDVGTHFTPRYRPWRQRVAVVPDGDMFHGIRAGKASVVTDEIERFTERGILLKSGRELEADIIITATGFNMSVFGDIEITLDGEPLNFGERWAHRGILFSGVPNFAWVFGYFRWSWTLRADMIADFVCRLLSHMQARGAKVVTPRLRPEDADMPKLPFIDADNFNPGYLLRAIHLLPKQGDRQPWVFSQDYEMEKAEIPNANLEDGTLIYE